MNKRTFLGKVLRILGILFLALSAAMTLVGGIGTSCVAFAAEKYPEFSMLAPYKWLYIFIVLAQIAAGVLAIRAIILLIKSTEGSYKATIISLVAGLAIGLIHVIASRILRGASMPADVQVYLVAITLLIFLLFHIPWLWEQIQFEKPKNDSSTRAATGFAAITSGLLIATSFWWAAPTHTFGNTNYAADFIVPLGIIGGILVLFGIGSLVKTYYFTPSISSETSPIAREQTA